MAVPTRVKGVLTPGSCLASGEYRINQLLGQGGFGITYQGLDTRLNREVAVKEFFPEGCWREGATVVSAGKWNSDTYSDAKQKFLLEAQTLGQFNHAGIVQIFYYFEENNTAYLVMEYLQGKTLAQLLKIRRGKLSVANALAYISKIGEALEILHQAQFLHRDIKPENIMLANDDRVVLIDFGAARDFTSDNTNKYTTMLTPGYAPLEQYGRALKYGAFTDIYALGATLYHLLTGETPTSAIERAAGVKLKSVKSINPQISSEISDAISQAMIMDVSKRLQSISQFMNLLGFSTIELPTKIQPNGLFQTPKNPWDAFNDEKILTSQPSRSSNNNWF